MLDVVSAMSVIMLTEAVARIHEIISGQDRVKGARAAATFAARPASAATKATPQPLMSLNPNPTGVRTHLILLSLDVSTRGCKLRHSELIVCKV